MTNVLIVDDSSGIADSIAKVLDMNGYNALALYDSTEALEHVKSIRFDVAFLGIVMPDIDGIELGARIRKFLPDCGIILGIEDVLGVSQQNALLSAHGFEYLPAPFEVEDLLRTVRVVRSPQN